MANETLRRCFQVHLSDNVATLLDDVQGGPVAVLGHGEQPTIEALGPISLGHKIALRPIAVGERVEKYGVPIGIATADIQPGEWVHLQNCRSRVDERSSHLDVKTGAPKDTVYA